MRGVGDLFLYEVGPLGQGRVEEWRGQRSLEAVPAARKKGRVMGGGVSSCLLRGRYA